MFNNKIVILILVLIFVFFNPVQNYIQSKLVYDNNNQTNNITANNSISEFHMLQYNEVKPINPDYNKVKEITGWDIDLVVYFVDEAEYRGVSVFEEAIPILSVETGDTYKFDLTSTNNDGTVNKGAFQINNTTYNYIIEQLKFEGRIFDTWDKLNPELNITAGLYWIAYLKNEHNLREDSLFTSYNRGVSGARGYAKRNNTYETSYSKKAQSVKMNY